MSDALRSCLLGQLDIAWALTWYHLEGLTTDECHWRPAATGLHVHRSDADGWTADWPEHEGYDLGPASLAWLTWHLGFWWSMALDQSFGPGTLDRNQIRWPGDAEQVRLQITSLHTRWREAIERLDPADLASSDRTRWPFQDRPFSEVVAWANLELMKSAAEIGYVRFLHAGRPRDASA